MNCTAWDIAKAFAVAALCAVIAVPLLVCFTH